MAKIDWDLRQLFNLLAIGRTGSFSRAAEARGISQPGLSASIAQLEKAVRRRVLERGRNGAKLTALGATLARHAEIIEAQLGQASSEAELQSVGLDGPLNLAVTPVTAVDIVPRAIGQLGKEIPDSQITVWETIHPDAMERLAIGSVDLCIGPLGVYPTPSSCAEVKLTDDRFCLVMRKGHPLAVRKSLALHDLENVSWALPSDQSAYQRQVEALFLTAGKPWPSRAAFTNSLTAMKGIVHYSDCIAIMPEQVVRQEKSMGYLTTVTLKDAGSVRQIGAVYMKNRPLSPLAERFIEILQEQYAHRT